MKIKIKTDTHVHRGKTVPVGSILETDDETARHFIAIGAADPVPTDAKVTIQDEEA